MVSKVVAREVKNEFLTQVEKHGRLFQGRGELIQFLKGFRVTRKEAIKAKCYDCMGFFDQSKDKDCRNYTCPLYGYMPYRNGIEQPEDDSED